MSATATATAPEELQAVDWQAPASPCSLPVAPPRNALLALQCASTMAKQFDREFALRSAEREASIPLFKGSEIILQSAQPDRVDSVYEEFALDSIRIVMDLVEGSLNDPAETARQRFAERCAQEVSSHSSKSDASIGGKIYSVKYLRKGLIDTDRIDPAAAMSAAEEFILETKILMNLAPHPHLACVYGVNAAGIDAFLEQGRQRFFVIEDRLGQRLPERIEEWKQGQGYGTKLSPDANVEASRLFQRLEVAIDIASALVFLHDRQLVMNIRPDKVGFDVRCGRVKICDFGQARSEGMREPARSLVEAEAIHILGYTAPEVLCGAPATTSTDVYAFALILWTIMQLQQPFEGLDKEQHFVRVVQRHERPALPGDWPAELVKLLSTAWDPHFRPTMKSVQEVLEMTLLYQDDFLNEKKMTQESSKTNAEGAGGHSTSPSRKKSRPKAPRRRSTGNGVEGEFGGSVSPKPRDESRRQQRKMSMDSGLLRKQLHHPSAQQSPQQPRKEESQRTTRKMDGSPQRHLPRSHSFSVRSSTMATGWPADHADDTKSVGTTPTVYSSGSSGEPVSPQMEQPRRQNSMRRQGSFRKQGSFRRQNSMRREGSFRSQGSFRRKQTDSNSPPSKKKGSNHVRKSGSNHERKSGKPRRRSVSRTRKQKDCPATPSPVPESPASPRSAVNRRAVVQGEAWVPFSDQDSTAPPPTKGAKPAKAPRGRMQRSESFQGNFQLDNLATPKRTPSVGRKPVRRTASESLTHMQMNPSPLGASKTPTRVMNKALSARDLAKNGQPQGHTEERRSMRMERTSASPQLAAKVMASAEHAAATSGKHKVLRVKVKRRPSEDN